MSVDFENEGQMTEAVTRQPSGSPQSGRLTGVLVLGLVSCILSYAWYANYHKPVATKSATEKEEFNTARNNPNLQLDTQEQPQDNKLVFNVPDKKPEEAAVAPPVINVEALPLNQATDDAEAKRLAELERLRREAEEKRLARLRSNMIVIDGTGVRATNAGPQGSANADIKDDDPNRRFVNRTSAKAVEMAQATKNERIDALIPQGTMIRGVLETAIQSDLPGMVRAITSTDIWSFDGRRILLPKGTMLTGEYKSALSRGQTRILIVWTRALRADGVSIALGSYGTDDLGRSGLTGDVDRHFRERFGSAAVLSLVGGVSSFIAGADFSGGQQAAAATGSTMAPDAQSQAQQTISKTFADMANTALRDSINIPPTIHVDQGTQIIVFVRRDLDFSGLYPDPVKEALRELRHPAKSR